MPDRPSEPQVTDGRGSILRDARSIEPAIFTVRGQRVMIDSDLAELYRVETRALLQAVRRSPDRFPVDFVFQLTQKELTDLRSQTVISRGSQSVVIGAPWPDYGANWQAQGTRKPLFGSRLR